MHQPGQFSFFTAQLIHWYRTENKRTMPWKGEKNPYRIWLSEIILQQTRVAQGLSYYNNFVNTYPTINDLAAATDEDVFKMWEGLGYYSRCKNILATARFVSTHLDGNFPKTYDGIIQLKGIGPYTASAIASFAFDLPHAVVDGNVYRVLSRFFGESVPIDSTTGKSFFNKLAHKLLYQPEPAIYNQAIMDFGATICTPKNPLCEDCPLSKYCFAYQHQSVNDLPVKEKQLKRSTRWFTYFIFSFEDKVLVRKRIGKDIWQSLHEFFLVETSKEKRWTKPAIKELVQREIGGTPFTHLWVSETSKQQLTHQTIHARFVHIQLNNEPASVPLYHWMAKDEIAKLAFPKLIVNYLQQNPISVFGV